MVATRAARRSLSPYRISLVATVSFSLMIGMARDHSLASAICPIAAEAWLSSSLRALLGSLAIVRPSAIAPEDTTTTLAPRLGGAARSEASASSHTRLTAPRTPSTRSDEPTLTTMRLNRSREGSLTTIAGIEDIRAPLAHKQQPRD